MARADCVTPRIRHPQASRPNLFRTGSRTGPAWPPHTLAVWVGPETTGRTFDDGSANNRVLSLNVQRKGFSRLTPPSTRTSVSKDTRSAGRPFASPEPKRVVPGRRRPRPPERSPPPRSLRVQRLNLTTPVWMTSRTQAAPHSRHPLQRSRGPPCEAHPSTARPAPAGSTSRAAAARPCRSRA